MLSSKYCGAVGAYSPQRAFHGSRPEFVHRAGQRYGALGTPIGGLVAYGEGNSLKNVSKGVKA
jgi:hypothetical protein